MKSGLILTAMLIINMVLLSPSYADSKMESIVEPKNSGLVRIRLSASGLKPNHKYVLTINGYVNHESNRWIKEECEEYKPTGEGFCNLDGEIVTDSQGSFKEVRVQVLPKAGRYKAKLLLKDKADGWRTVWASDHPYSFDVLELIS